MPIDAKSQTAKHWLQIQFPRLLGLVLLLFVGYVVADIVVAVWLPDTSGGQDSLEIVFKEMRSFSYWLRKLVLTFSVTLFYLAVLWALKPRKHS